MKNSIVGWLQIGNVPLTRAFKIDIDASEMFSNSYMQELATIFVKCDLDGHVDNAFGFGQGACQFGVLVDMLFSTYAVNAKDYLAIGSTATYNNKPISFPIEECSLKSDKTQYVVDASQARDEVIAQFVIIDGTYVYFSCTSYSFYKPIEPFLSETLHSLNLGGWLVKLGMYKEIDSLLKYAT